ncbi:MAG: alpha-amylase family glycosyl hydrolase, partial [Bacteroidota bacterium]
MKLIPSKSWGRLPWLVLTLSFLSFAFFSCTQEVEEQTEEAEVEAVSVDTEWEKDANIYEVNIRQYTEEGTINAFAQHLPRLQEMGVEILWFMPIFPISEKKKKGSLGSYYAISDYREVNPNFGTKEDFQKVVDQAHELGMKVILDWVPNHTGWDHTWLTENPDWYTQDSLGNVIDPIDPKTGESWGWTDVADLNYNNTEMRAAMRTDM